MTQNDFLQKVLNRVKELADLKMPDLRMEFPEAIENANQAQLYALGMSRGDLIEHIVYSEFALEFDREIYCEE